MKKSTLRVAAVGAVVALFGTMSPLAAFAATTPPYDTTTDAPIYLMDGTDATGIAPDTQLDWNYGNGIVLTANPVPADLGDLSWATFAPVAGATNYIGFLSAPGSERTPTAWKQYSQFGGSTSGVVMPSVWPSYLGNGAPAAVKAAGGTYSMGIAFTDSPIVASTHVIKAYYTTINVDAGTGTWKFATPPAACTTVNSDIATTTTLEATPASLEAGQTTVLKATVAAAKALPASNVEFFEGTTSLGTVGLASGSATKTVTVATAGTHTYTAKYADNVVETAACPNKTTDTFKASTSADLSVTATVPDVQLPPNSPSENALNTSTANGATATYDAATHKATLTVPASATGKTVNTFVYSAPTFLGSLTVVGTTVTFDVSQLAAGDHKMVIVDANTGDVLAWATFTKTDAAIAPSISKTINADVANGTTPADGEFSIIDTSGSNTVNLTNPTLVNGASVVSGQLGTFKVTDLRVASKPGWDLKTDVTDFAKGSDTISKSALGIAPKQISNAGTGATAATLGTAQITGAASYPWNFASLAAAAFSGVTVYNADLVFTAPAGSPAGTYTSTLTLTLISK